MRDAVSNLMVGCEKLRYSIGTYNPLMNNCGYLRIK